MDNPLHRYTTPEMDRIWSDRQKHRTWRLIWLDVLQWQIDHGIHPGQEAAIDSYGAVLDVIDLDAIHAREQQTGHDVKAAIDFWNSQTCYQLIHHGMTSHDIVDNAHQILTRRATHLLIHRAMQLATRIQTWERRTADFQTVGRTHNRPAQLIGLAQRFHNWRDELEHNTAVLQETLVRWPLRGIRGAVGDGADMEALIEEQAKPGTHWRELNQWLARRLGDGIGAQVEHCGQIYPRSIDLPLAAAVLSLAAPASSLAATVRLMTGQGHASEQFTAGQTGSTAMPHKRNPILSERIHALHIVARGYHQMVVETAGGQWYEGDVSTSATRRIAYPGLWGAVDGILSTADRLLSGLQLHYSNISFEVMDEAVMVSTGRLLHAMVRNGVMRETAHELLREHSAAAQEQLDSGGSRTFLARLLTDERCKLSREDVNWAVGPGTIGEGG